MTKWLFNNLSLKIGSLLIAILLWFHVVTEKQVTEAINSPIRLQNLPKNLVITKTSSDTVTFRIKTKIKQLILLELFGHPFMNVDISHTTWGKNSIKLSSKWIVLPSWRPLDITEIVNPKQLIIITDKKSTKTTEVKPILKGKPHENYFVKAVRVKPDSVELIGGKQNLKKIKVLLTDTIDISNREKNFTVDVPLIMPGEGFSTKAKTVMVTIHLEKYQLKTFYGIPITLKGEGNYTVEPSSIDVTVKGSVALLNNLKPGDIKVFVDVQNTQKEIIPYFNLPAGVFLETSKPQKVKLRLKKPKTLIYK